MDYVRYAIQMEIGGFMKQEWNGSLERIRLNTVDNPIYANLFNKRQEANRVLEEIINGNSNLLVTYDEDNPPKKVIKIKIMVEVD